VKSRQNLRVALVWNGTVFQEKTFTNVSSNTVSVGDHRVNDFFVPADGLPERFEMFARRGDGYHLRLTDGLEGKVHFSGEDYALEDLWGAQGVSPTGSVSAAGGGNVNGYELTINEGDWGVLNMGDITVFFQFVDTDTKIFYRGFSGMEWPLLGFIFLALIGHMAILILAELQYDPNMKSTDLNLPDRFVEFLSDEPPDPPEEEEEEDLDDDTTGKKAGGEEGKFGDPDSEIPDSKIPKVDGEMVDKIDVKDLGINKAINQSNLANLFGDVEMFDAKMNIAMSGEGNTLVVGRGAGGMGLRGVGRGGGGEGFGRIHGLGKVDTGGGRGVNAKIGGKGKAKVKARVTRGAARVGQFCAKSNIQAVVRRGVGAIKYCFDKQLQLNPSLSGKIVVNWTVNLQGRVLKVYVASSSMRNKTVESCMTRVVKRWRFEPPKGGHCAISYPFTFKGAM
jgi:TonB family protein